MADVNPASTVDLLPAAEKAYRNYNWSLLVLITFRILVIIVSNFVAFPQQIYSVIQALSIIMALAVLVFVYRLTGLLKENGQCKTSPVMWCVLMIFPVVNLIGIFYIFSKTRKYIKALKGGPGPAARVS